MNVQKSKTMNIMHAKEMIDKARSTKNVQLVALPECFNSPYGTSK